MINGLICTKITQELKKSIESGKIQKIYQLNDNEILFKIRAFRQNHQLISSIDANNFRLHLSNLDYISQEVATNFTMVLRKQIEGAIIKEIYQYECDRVIIFRLEKHNELRELKTRYLIFELLGRHANTILCDGDMIIIDLLKKTYLLNPNARMLARNLKFEFMPSNKLNPLIDIQQTDDYFTTYQGFDKILNQEFIKSKLSPQTLLEDFLKSKEFYLYPKTISAIPLTHLNEEPRVFNSISQALDHQYRAKYREGSSDTFKKEIKAITNFVKKNQRKIKKLQAQFKSNLDYDKYQKLGTLLYDNIYQYDAHKHYDEVRVMDYETNEEITIKLDNAYNYKTNAQKYLNKYNKLKKSFTYLNEQIEKAEKENEYLQDILATTSYINVNDMSEIIDELRNNKFIFRSLKQPKKKKKMQPKFETFISTDGVKILVGKNNIQNDFITFKLAKKSHYWLHIKNQPGAHVIIMSDDPSDETLLEAALLATYYSKTQEGVSYDVDYTQVKNLKKEKELGKVTFNTYQTLRVVNDIQITKKLKKG